MKRPSKTNIENLYWEIGLSQSEIAGYYGVSDATVSLWMKHHNICSRSLSESAILMYKLHPKRAENNRKKGQKSFDKTPSHSLAYILGVMLGDGSIDKNHYRLRLEVKSVKFAQKFAENLNEIGMKPYLCITKKRTYPYRQYQLVGVSRKAFYEWYIGLTLEDIGVVIDGYEQDFVCGFYESEGYIGYNYGLNQGIIISNNNKDLLSFIKGIMESWGFKPTLRNNTSTNFLLCLYGTKNVRNFISMINPCIRIEPKAKNMTFVYKNKRHTEREYKAALKLKKQGQSYHGVARSLSIPYTVIYGWVKQGKNPIGVEIQGE